MAKCEICGKGQLFGHQVSHSHKSTNRAWKPNVKKVKLTINGVTKRMAVCTSCIRSNKNSD